MRSEYISPLLQELVGYYSNRLSYKEVEKLVERISGEKLLSDQKIWQIIVNKAEQVSVEWQQENEEIDKIIKTDVAISSEVDIYDPDSPEILMFDDAIGVKKQKENREKLEKKEIDESENISKASRKFIITDVILLEKPSGGFKYITSPIDAQGKPLIPLEEMVKYQINYYYENHEALLPVVAITDGASNIRKRLSKLGSKGITLILDWYHLCKKIRNLLSMISRNKREKQEHSKNLLLYLWRGENTQAMNYLSTKIETKNQQKLEELKTYFKKHESEIIDYERRQKAGKSIGSGRVEKAVDLVIGHRQKRKGMSWSSLGSKALAILKVVELNGEWQQFWFW
ncbi:MAG: UPF0236 family protein [Crocosphaera sp.]|uniref:UPF0236 family transposase-like protein n=1 Tax=Crocosphaera sp. TaxID=2729996 RepID=UPI00258A38F7|nr:UPF0236 family protein [Crocosphaera sp.]MCH2247806.1 UPF0236 family protein [Crocosphaera sp.]